MTEKQLIEKLNKLSEIKPRKEWVVLTKNQILGATEQNIVAEKANILGRFTSIMEVLRTYSYQRKLAFALSGILLIALGTVGFVGYSNLGAKKDGQVAFIPTEFLTKSQLEAANNSLENLTKLVKENRSEDITPAVNKFKASLNDAVNSLLESVKNDPSSIKDIAKEVKKIKDNQVLLDNLDVKVDLGDSSEVLYKAITEQEIANFEKLTLTQEQKDILTSVKELYEKGKYAEAFEKIYTEFNSLNIQN